MNFLKELSVLLAELKADLRLSSKNTILFVDIDDTLFQTHAQVIVEDKETGEEITRLNSSEFNHYKLDSSSHKYNFKQFTDAMLFKTTSTVIKKTLDKLHVFQKTFDKPGKDYKNNKIIFITARANMDKKDVFLEAFERVGIRVHDKDRVYIRRVGSEMRSGETVHDAKARIMRNYLDSFRYERAIFFDDSESNLRAFQKTSSSYSDTEFLAIGVSSGQLFFWSEKRKQRRPVA